MYFQYIPRINSISVDILNACACVCECMHAFVHTYMHVYIFCLIYMNKRYKYNFLKTGKLMPYTQKLLKNLFCLICSELVIGPLEIYNPQNRYVK